MTRPDATSERGFTLVEVMAAIFVFAVMTVGVAPLLASSLRGVTQSRAATVGKNVAVETMERMRGFPYFVEYQASGRQAIDLLDLYFPNLGTGYDAATGTFTTTCVGAATDPDGCPADLPPGYTVSIAARFVVPNDTGGYDPAEIPPDYQWDPATPSKDFPPSQLLDATVTAAWTIAGEPRSYSLQSLITEKGFLEERIRGSARIDFGVKVTTTFVNSAGNQDELTATAGTAESRISSRLVPTADQLVRSSRLHLVRLATETTTAQDLQTLEGAKVIRHAPPDVASTSASALPQLMQYQEDAVTVLDIAGNDSTSASDVALGVANELPHARGTFGFSTALSDTDGDGDVDTDDAAIADFWVNNQADRTQSAVLRLDPLSNELVAVETRDGATLTGGTRTTTTATTSGDPNVTSTATMSFERLRLFRALLPVLPQDVVRIDDFTATLTCKSTATGTPTVPTVSWSATLTYFRDLDPTDNISSGGYAPPVALGSDLPSTTDPLAAIGPANNPLVYDGATALDDVYLFEDPATGRNGYLTSWNTSFDPTTSSQDGGEVTSAGIDTAIFMHTAPTDPLLPDSGLKISVGKLSCESVDRRS